MDVMQEAGYGSCGMSTIVVTDARSVKGNCSVRILRAEPSKEIECMSSRAAEQQ